MFQIARVRSRESIAMTTVPDEHGTERRMQ